jgi:hypothetical protein
MRLIVGPRKSNPQWPSSIQLVRIFLNILGAVLLLSWAGEFLPIGSAGFDSMIISFLAWIYALIPMFCFLALREPLHFRFPRLSRWWPAMGIAFAISIVQLGIQLSKH